MIKDVLSTLLKRALTENSQAVDWAPIDIQPTEPAESNDNGIFVAGHLGGVAPAMIKVAPFCAGGPGSDFRMRVWGWWTHTPGAEVWATVWLPLLIAEFACVAGIRNGLGDRAMKANEFMANQMTLVGGTVGKGVVVSPGPDSDASAWANIDLQGCRKFQFDFKQGVAASAFGNTWWCSTSGS